MSYMTILFKMVWCKRGEGRRGREREKERGREGEVGGIGLMTPGLSKGIRCHE